MMSHFLILYNERATGNAALTSDNVSQLGVAWSIETPELVSHAPIPDGDRIYFADWSGVVYAADASTGTIVWQNQVEQPNEKWAWHGLAGTGVLVGDTLFEASVEGNVFAIDTATGDVKWQAPLTDQANAGSLATPLFHDGKVYLGLQSVEEALTSMQPDYQPKFQGQVVAVDAASGMLAWETALVTGDQNGVAVWGSFALDPDLGLLYATTGNNYTGEASEMSDSILALDAASGEIKWYHQATDADVWTPANPKGPDVDFGAGPQLFEAIIDGETRQLVGAGQKSGVYWALDRETGEVVWTAQVGKSGIGGGIRGEAAVSDKRVLVWSNNAWDDTKPNANPADYPINVKALDKATGSEIWSQENVQPAIGTSAGFAAADLYIVGSLDGTLQAYSQANGDVLWSTRVPGSISSSLVVQGDTLFLEGV